MDRHLAVVIEVWLDLPEAVRRGITAMVEDPEAVKELAHKAKQLLFSFLDAWIERYGKELVSYYPPYYMPEGIALSEDEVGSVNEEMFVEFFLRELVEMSQRYGGLGMHCCATARHQWENFKRIPGLKLLNMPQSLEGIRETYAFFADHNAVQYHTVYGEGPAWPLPEEYPPEAKVVIEHKVDSRKEALELAQKFHSA